MCMKYVNANIQCFGSINNIFLGNTGFSSLLASVNAKEKHGKYSIGGFSIVTFISIRGTKGKNNPSNPLDGKKKLLFRIRLTKLDEDESKQLSYDLKDFEIDLSKEENVHHACFDYVDRIEIVNVDGVLLESDGPYTIKLLVKEEGSNLFDVQIAHNIYIKKSQSKRQG